MFLILTRRWITKLFFWCRHRRKLFLWGIWLKNSWFFEFVEDRKDWREFIRTDTGMIVFSLLLFPKISTLTFLSTTTQKRYISSVSSNTVKVVYSSNLKRSQTSWLFSTSKAIKWQSWSAAYLNRNQQ